VLSLDNSYNSRIPTPIRDRLDYPAGGAATGVGSLACLFLYRADTVEPFSCSRVSPCHRPPLSRRVRKDLRESFGRYNSSGSAGTRGFRKVWQPEYFEVASPPRPYRDPAR